MTTDTNALADLIARLEAASEGSRELDVAIYNAIHGTTFNARQVLAADATAYEVAVGKYTSSLDAALTLVPEGWIWRYYPQQHVPHYVSVAQSWDMGGYVAEVDSSPALALCSAALRARTTP